jgi:hypothetical protein
MSYGERRFGGGNRFDRRTSSAVRNKSKKNNVATAALKESTTKVFSLL